MNNSKHPFFSILFIILIFTIIYLIRSYRIKKILTNPNVKNLKIVAEIDINKGFTIHFPDSRKNVL